MQADQQTHNSNLWLGMESLPLQCRVTRGLEVAAVQGDVPIHCDRLDSGCGPDGVGGGDAPQREGSLRGGRPDGIGGAKKPVRCASGDGTELQQRCLWQ